MNDNDVEAMLSLIRVSSGRTYREVFVSMCERHQLEGGNRAVSDEELDADEAEAMPWFVRLGLISRG